jgi:Arc/MetJ-type ribon-helix-helix transcriptional regulator
MRLVENCTSCTVQSCTAWAEIIATAEPGGETTATRANVVTFRVTDAELAAIDALVESGAMRSRSEASGWLLHAGITAKQDFFDQIRQLGDEITRLRQQVQQLADEHIGRRTAVEDAAADVPDAEPVAGSDPSPTSAPAS